MNTTQTDMSATATAVASDAQLVAAALAGDIDRLGMLYTRHYRAVVGIAFCAIGDHQAAEDAAQEAFAVACRDLWSLKQPAKFAGWVCGIARKVAIRAAKRRRRQILKPNFSETVFKEKGDERHEQLRQAVARLPTAAKEVIVLHYYSGMSHKEIAAALNISADAVHGRLIRARRKIKAELHELGKAEEQHE